MTMVTKFKMTISVASTHKSTELNWNCEMDAGDAGDTPPPPRHQVILSLIFCLLRLLGPNFPPLTTISSSSISETQKLFSKDTYI